MASVKQHFSKGLGYIKFDIQQLQEERAELIEFIGYHKDMDTYIARVRVAKAKADLERVEIGLNDLNNELLFYKDYFNYTQDDIDNAPIPTQEQVNDDWQRILAEKDDDTWTQADHDALMQRVHDLDVSLGRITQ